MDVFAFALYLGELLDMFGVIIIVMGVFVSTAVFLKDYFTPKKFTESELYKHYRANLGRAILLGLEILVAGDIIRSVVGDPDFRTLGLLVIIVLIRTFMSIVFSMEIDSRWPWQKKTS